MSRELAVSQDECKLLSEQVTARVDAETGELKSANQILMLELQQRDQELAKVLYMLFIYDSCYLEDW